MFYEQLNKVCKEKGTTITALLRKMNLAKQNGTNWKNGGSPSAEVLNTLAKELDTNMDYLWNGNNIETLNKEEKEIIDKYNNLPDKKKGRLVQFLYSLQENDTTEELEETKNIEYRNYIETDIFTETVSAGTGIYLTGSEKETLEIEKNYETVRADYILKISGNSMNPMFHDEDLIMIKYTPSIEVGEIGIFLINNESFVKKFGGDRLISLNKNYKDILLNEYDDIRCQGKVIGILDKNWIKK